MAAEDESEATTLAKEEPELFVAAQVPLPGDAIPTPATGSESLTSPEEAQARAREIFDRMGVFRGLRRELTEREWNSAGTRILILERLTQLEIEVNDLKIYKSQYYEKDKESAVLRQKLHQSAGVENLFDFSLAAGGVLVGLATFLFDKSLLACIVTGLMGLVLLIAPLRLKHR